MKIIKYFIELLDTLKKIEAHLNELSSCVGKQHNGYNPAVRINPYS
jgi:hypothetical protein